MDPFEMGNESGFTEPGSARGGLDSIKRNMVFLAKWPDPLFSNPFFIELIERTKINIGSINNYIQICRGKFSDKEFDEYYYRVMTGGVEKMEIVLNSLTGYTKLHAPIRKMNTVRHMIEEVLKRHRVKLGEKRIKLLKRFEKDLPETVVPDEQLKYVLNEVLQYAMTVTPPGWNIAVSTKSLLIEKETAKPEGPFGKDGKYVEISVIFALHPRGSEPLSERDALQKEEVPDILLRFVKEVVSHNHGMMKMGVNKKGMKTLISLRFPVERRKVVCDHV